MPPLCILDPDGDMVRRLRKDGRAKRFDGWPCYHTELDTFELAGQTVGIVGCAVGAPFAVLIAEELFACGCRLLISVTSAGQIVPAGPTPYFVIIDRALRDEGTSYHYAARAEFAEADPALVAMAVDALKAAGFAPSSARAGRPTRRSARPRRRSRRRGAGILAVEMEAAALYTFAKARGGQGAVHRACHQHDGAGRGRFREGRGRRDCGCTRVACGDRASGDEGLARRAEGMRGGIQMPGKDRTSYIVLRPDETSKGESGPSSLIPTLGAATTAIDQYRTVGILNTNLRELSCALTDVTSAAALAKIAEGNITSADDIATAEMALQALLLYDDVHIVTCAPKADFGNGFIGYIRTDEGRRTQLSFDIFALAQSRDWLIAPEFVKIDSGTVVESSLSNSPIVLRTVSQLSSVGSDLNYVSSQDISDALVATLQEHAVPLCLSDPALVHSHRGDGFAKRFYGRMNISWQKAVGDMPPVVSSLSLPPLLAIVLDRLNNRADLLQELKALRNELAPVRTELHELNSIVSSARSQADVERRIKRIDESFDAAVSESRLQNLNDFGVE